jgi:hypothetical protein
MARVLNGPLKGMRGKLGNIVLKRINGETYACKKPIYNKTNNPSVLARRKRFALNIKLSKCINEIPELKGFWRRVLNGKMSTHNAIVKANYTKVGNDELIGVPYLTPDSFAGFNSDLGFLYEEGRISIEFSPEKYWMKCEGENYVKAVGVMCMSGALFYGKEDCSIFSVESDMIRLKDGEERVLLIRLDDYQYSLMKSYSKRKLYFGFVMMDKDGKVLKEVSTFGMELEEK